MELLVHANPLELRAHLDALFEWLPIARPEQALLAMLPQNSTVEDLNGEGYPCSCMDAYPVTLPAPMDDFAGRCQLTLNPTLLVTPSQV